MVASLNFAGNGPDDLATAGCHPFLVAYTSQSDHDKALDDEMVTNQLDQGDANASLDICDIHAKEKIKLPRDLNQVSLILATMLHHFGTQHPVPRTRKS